MLRRLPALLTVGLLALAAPLVSATAADAAPAVAASVSSSAHHITIPSNYVYAPHTRNSPRLHDYCSDSPDWFPAPGRNADFRGPCARHDMCIEFHQKQRSTCDGDLKTRMHDECNWTYSGFFDFARRKSCNATADVYWAVVRTKTFFS